MKTAGVYELLGQPSYMSCTKLCFFWADKSSKMTLATFWLTVLLLFYFFRVFNFIGNKATMSFVVSGFGLLFLHGLYAGIAFQ